MMVLARTQMFFHDSPEALEAIKLGWVFAVSILGVAFVVEMRMERMRKKEEVARLKVEKSKIEEKLRMEKGKEGEETQTTMKRKRSVVELEKKEVKKEGSKEILVKSNKKKDTTKVPEPTQAPLQNSKPASSSVPPKPPAPPTAPPTAPPKPQSPKKPAEKTLKSSQTSNVPRNSGKPLSLIDEIKAFNRKELKRREERDKDAIPPDGIFGALSTRLESIRSAVGLGDETEDVDLISEEWKD